MPPSATVTDSNGDNKPEVSGKAEPDSTLTITWPDRSTTTTTADSNGNYTAEAPTEQGSGTVSVAAQDKEGNASPRTDVTYTDGTPPAKPNMTVSDADGDGKPKVTGTAEPNSTIIITWPDGTSITVTADANGDFDAESDTAQLSGNVTAQAFDAENNPSPVATASFTAAAPIIDVTDIKGELQLGQTLTGVYDFDANGGNQTDASILAWKNGGHTETTLNYVLDTSDVGKVLTFEVTAKNGVGIVGNTDSMTTADAPGVTGGGSVPPGSVIDPNQPSATLSAMAALPTQITANGTDASVITFTARNEANQPIPGLVVTFDVTGLADALLDTVAEGANGTYTASFSGNKAGIATLVPKVAGTVVGSLSASVKLVADFSSARFDGLPAIIGDGAKANGTEQISVEYRVIDALGNPLEGVDLVVTTTNGTSPSTVTLTTDANGVVKIDVTNVTAGPAQVTATLGSQSQTANIHFVGDPATAE